MKTSHAILVGISLSLGFAACDKARSPQTRPEATTKTVPASLSTKAPQALLDEAIRGLDDRDPDVRAVWASALGGMGPAAERAVPKLIEAIKDAGTNSWGFPQLAFNAAQALGNIGPKAKAAVPELTRLLKSPTTPLPRIAAIALGRIGEDASPAVPALIERLSRGQDADWYVSEEAVVAIGSIGLKGEADVIKALESEDPLVRGLAAQALGIMRSSKAVEKLAGLLKDKDPFVRALSAWALAEMRSPNDDAGKEALAVAQSSVLELGKLVQGADSPSVTRLAAMHALGVVGQKVPGPAGILIAAFRQPVPVRPEAAKAIAKMGGAVVSELLAALVGGDQGKAEGAAIALGEIGPAARAGVPALAKAARSESDMFVRIAATEALCKIGPDAKEAIPALIMLLGDSEWIIPCKAADALGTMGPDAKPAVDALARCLKHEEEHVRESAALALGKIGAAAVPAAGALQQATSDKSKIVAAAAKVALAQIPEGSR